MYKVGVMMMGSSSPNSNLQAKVKQIILEVEAKTKIINIFEYLLELNKIKDMNVSVSLEKGGAFVNQTSTISQVLKYTRPLNGIIKLYCYEQKQYQLNESVYKIVLKPSRHQVNNPEALKSNNSLANTSRNATDRKKQDNKNINSGKETEVEEEQTKTSSKFCCC